MNLHENPTLFKEAIQFTAQQKNLPSEYIEKDYWITYVLYILFSNENFKEDIVFKGGTALSKCYKLIDRFSEDIDLIVIQQEGESGNQLKQKIKRIGTLVNVTLPEEELAGITRKHGNSRKTAHTYSKVFKGDYGQVRDKIILEATSLGYFEPYIKKKIQSFIGEMMFNTNQEALAEKHNLLPFEISVLDPTRTICEKIMSLVRFSYSDAPLEALRDKVRHTYDLHQLLRQSEFKAFFMSKEFDQMLVRVGEDDVVSYPNNNKWLVHHPKESLIFKELDSTWEQMKISYSRDFKNLVFGKFPKEDEIKNTLQKIKERLSKVEWGVSI